MSDTDIGKLEAKIDVLIRLLAISVSPDNLSLAERASRLTRAGMTPKEIAAICETTANTVSVALSKAKKAKKRG